MRAGYHLNDNSAETIEGFIEHFSGSAKNPVRCRRRLIGIFVLQNTGGRPRSTGPIYPVTIGVLIQRIVK